MYMFQVLGTWNYEKSTISLKENEQTIYLMINRQVTDHTIAITVTVFVTVYSLGKSIRSKFLLNILNSVHTLIKQKWHPNLYCQELESRPKIELQYHVYNDIPQDM